MTNPPIKLSDLLGPQQASPLKLSDLLSGSTAEPEPSFAAEKLSILSKLPVSTLRALMGLVEAPIDITAHVIENLTGGPYTSEEILSTKPDSSRPAGELADWQRRYDAARAREEALGQQAVAEKKLAESPGVTIRHGEGLGQFVARMQAQVKATGVDRAAEAEATLEGKLLGFLPHIFALRSLDAVMEAQNPQEASDAIASAAVGTVAFISPFAKGGLRAPPPEVPPAVPRSALLRGGLGLKEPQAIIQRSAAERVAMTRQIDDLFPGPRNPWVPVPERDLPLPIEGEFHALKMRLLDEAAGDQVRVIARAQQRSGDYGTTVIAGMDASETGGLERYLKTIEVPEPPEGFAVGMAPPPQGIAVHYKPSPEGGAPVADVAVFGAKSPLAASEKLRAQFEDTGFFEGQEVSLDGKNYVIDELGKPGPEPGDFFVALRGEAGEVLGANTRELRRLSVTEVSLPIAAITRAEPFTPYDAAVEITTAPVIPGQATMMLGPEGAAQRTATIGTIFDRVIAQTLALESGEITTIPKGKAYLWPGVKAFPLVERFPELARMFDDPLPETTIFIYTTREGVQAGYMEVNHFLHGGFPEGKSALGITGFIVDPRLPAITQGRAAIALMEQASTLGVTRVFGGVDQAGLRMIARYINEHLGKKKQTVQMKFGVGEMRVDAEGIWNDFQQYNDQAMSSRRVASRLSGHDLSQTKVKDANGEPVRVYHGTDQAFDAFDPAEASPYSLAGPGFYFTTDPRVASGYARGQLKYVRDLETVEMQTGTFDARDARIAELERQYPGSKVTTRISSTADQVRDGTATVTYRLNYYESGNVRPAFLDIRNPLDMDASIDPGFARLIMSKEPFFKQLVGEERATQFLDEMKTNTNLQTNHDLYNLISEHLGLDQGFVDLAREFGHDGIHYDGGLRVQQLDAEGKPITHDVWIAWEPSQVVDHWIGGALSFDAIVDAYAKEAGFMPEEVPGLRRYLAQRMAKELREQYLSPEEKEMWNEAASYLRETFGREPSAFETLAEVSELQLPLSNLASTNNVTAEWRPGGVIEVRARDQAGTLLGYFYNEAGARDFINRLGQAKGEALEGGGKFNDIPADAIGGGATPPPPGIGSHLMSGIPPNLPPDPFMVSWMPPGDRVPRLADYYASTLTLIADWEHIINAYDARYGTTMGNHVRAITEKLRIIEAQRHPWLLRLHDADKLLKGKGKKQADRMRVLMRYAETMTSEELATGGGTVTGKPMTGTELNIGNILAEMRVDLSRAEEFARRSAELEEKLAGDKLQEARRDLVHELRMDKDHTAAAVLLEAVRNMEVDEAYVGHVIRYADSKMMEAAGLDTSPEGFATANKLTPLERQAMDRLDVIGQQLANEFGIPEYRQLRRWLPHYVAYNERGIAPTQAFLGQKGLGSMKELRFISELARTGELTHYVQDPVLAMARYINAGFRSKHLNATLANAVKAFDEGVARLPEGAPARAIQANLARYLEDVRGVPEASRSMIATTISEILKRFGVEVSGDVGRNALNAVLSTYSLKFIAFRPFQGLRDYWSGWGSGYQWFGIKRARLAHKLGFGASLEELYALQRAGAQPPGMSPIELDSPAATLTGAIGLRRGATGVAVKALSKYVDFVQATSELGLKYSLQPWVYTRWHAGWYREGRGRAIEAYKKFSTGELSDAAVYKQLGLDDFQPSVVRELEGLTRAGKFEEAAHLYGQEVGKLAMVTYGRTMHPKGWNTNIGRILGHYGRYPTWYVNNLIEGLSRGSKGARVQRLVRIAIFHALTYAILEKTMGVDSYNWMMLPSARWLGEGGPVPGLMRAVSNMASPNDATRVRGRSEVARQLTPVPQAGRDIFAALGLMDENAPKPTNPLEILIRASGARLSEQPSLLDRLLGTQ